MQGEINIGKMTVGGGPKYKENDCGWRTNARRDQYIGKMTVGGGFLPQINPVFVYDGLATSSSSTKVIKIKVEFKSTATTKETIKALESLKAPLLAPLLSSICSSVTKVIILFSLLRIR